MGKKAGNLSVISRVSGMAGRTGISMLDGGDNFGSTTFSGKLVQPKFT